MKPKISRKSLGVSHKSSGVSNKAGIFPLRLMPYTSLIFFIFLFALCILPCGKAAAQGVAINTTGTAADASAMLDVTSTTQGLLIPRMTLAQRNAIATPATSLLVYQTDGTAGYYYYNGTAWVSLFSNNTGWALTGNDISAATSSFLGTTSNNDLIIKTNNTEVARILANGKVGIGTTNPLRLMHLNGANAQILNTTTNDNSGYSEIIFGEPSTLLASAVGWDAQNNKMFIRNNFNTAPIIFEVSNGSQLEAMRVIYNGNIGIGTTNPGAKLEVRTDGSGANTVLFRNDQTGYGTGSKLQFNQFGNQLGYIKSQYTSGPDGWETAIGGYDRIVFQTGSTYTECLRINANGNVGIGTTAPTALLSVNGAANNTTGVWGVFSDRRLKRDIEPLQGALSKILQLQGVRFCWKDSAQNAQLGRVRGFIAQDVEKVIPEWVKTSSNGFKQLETIGMDAMLVEAIKEQQQQIEKLQSENQKQQTLNTNLQTEIETLKIIIEKIQKQTAIEAKNK